MENRSRNEVIDVPGYTHVKWADVLGGDVVWLQGRSNGKPHAYGPHRVISRDFRVLSNSQGTQFRHYPEDLIIPKNNP